MKKAISGLAILAIFLSAIFVIPASAASTPSITVAGKTTTSISFNTVYPTSGAYGNRIELWDTVTGQWRETGNAFYVTNGKYTFSGLVSGRQYMGRLTYLSGGKWVVKDSYVSTTAVTPSITVAATTTTSISFNTVYPSSGAYGNRIELWDSVTGQWREAGNAFYVTNGKYTFSGLAAGRRYMGRLTYLSGSNTWLTKDYYVSTIAATPSITVSSKTTTSLTFNTVYPSSGVYGNRIELWDSVTGQWREAGNAFYVTNGKYTFSGLFPGRLYMGRLTYWTGSTWIVKDLHVSTVTPTYTKEGRNVKIDFADSYLSGNITPANLTRWINHLDAAYDAYYALVGKKPNGGNKINIVASSDTIGWAWVYGNTSTIYWNKDYIKGELLKINDNDDWSFGILHEMGHLFDLNDRWNFDAEFWANFKMVYVLETLNAKVYQNKYYTGNAIHTFFKTDASNSYAKTFGLANPKYTSRCLFIDKCKT